MVGLAAMLLFVHGQTTERTINAAERLACALGVKVKVLPYWGEIAVTVEGSPTSKIVPAKPVGVDMGRVHAVAAVVNRICDGTLPAEAAQSALASAGALPPASTLRFTCFAALGAASLGVIFGTLDPASLLLIAASSPGSPGRFSTRDAPSSASRRRRWRPDLPDPRAVLGAVKARSDSGRARRQDSHDGRP
jgi:uncharacterized membrane protein YjjP (DUF1212 family)